ncbi:hypothetical protein QCE63_35240 [Caballeronia sp. LZ065]|uniref:SMI1/KNR4 family protein n=1 Tax=Caballeronia sp. LZ065 TaxID=3038571 RepID=UPI002858AE17|nr:SMI1/KNR4 family protein [Caballeronia sp. LZ065]MDR5784647.1 hypothetical protein [Caballeronia sp. LZ065]
MAGNFDFTAQGVSFVNSAGQVTQEQIESVLPFHFDGKEFFVEFYLSYNGGIFLNGARFYRNKIHRIQKGGYTSVEIEGFYFIPRFEGERVPKLMSIPEMWRINKKSFKTLELFSKAHFPFAADASGNNYWIDIETGKIKYIAMDSDGSEVEVAPSFSIFCRGIQPES